MISAREGVGIALAAVVAALTMLVNPWFALGFLPAGYLMFEKAFT